MNYERIFTFGCSFTEYTWPTWADVLAVQSKIPVFNGARAGMGNPGIACRIVEYDQKFKFTDKDLILVMWTSWTREDRYIKDNWISAGNVFNNPFYDKNFINKYWSWDNDIIKNASSMILVNKGFNIGENYFAIDMLENDEVPESSWFDFYRNALPTGPRFVEDYNCFDNRIRDRHPDILNHVNFYNEHVASKFGFDKVKENSIFHKWQQYLVGKLDIKQSDNDQKIFIKSYFDKHRSMLSIR